MAGARYDWYGAADIDKVKKEKFWILDFSFYIYNGTYAFKRPCKCQDATTHKGKEGCERCGGAGYIFFQNKEGFVTGGLYHVMDQIVQRISKGYKIIIAFDPPKEDLIRTKLLDGYKGNRGEKPEYIHLQMAYGEKLLALLPTVECYTSDVSESDDIMAAIAVKLSNAGHYVVVASDDKDMYPLLRLANCDIYRQKVMFTREDFIEKYSFEPARFNEYLALCGDAADNFNLFKGIGDKAAKYLIDKYDDVRELYDDWSNVPAKYQKCLSYEREDKSIFLRREDMDLSMVIATLDENARCIPVDVVPDGAKIKEMLKYLEFTKCLNNLDLLMGDR